MRTWTALLCAVLLLTGASGAASAQNGSGAPDCGQDPEDERCQSAQESCEEGESPQECRERYCEEHPCDGQGNATAGGNATTGNTSAGNETAEGNGTDDRGADSRSAANACRGADDRETCFEAYCTEHQDARDCRAFLEFAALCGGASGHCRGGVAPQAALQLCHQHARSCEGLEDLVGIHGGLRHVGFDVDREGQALLNYSIDGRLYLEALQFSSNGTEWEVEKRGTQVRFSTDDARLAVHDNPTGTFWFRSEENATLFLMPPPGANVTFTDGGARIQYDGYRAILSGGQIEPLDGGILLSGEAGFHAPPASPPGAVVRQAVEDAIAQRRLGASVDARGAEAEVVSYDDVDVNVSVPASINATSVLRVEVGADLAEGRTIVIDIDPERLAGPERVVRYFDVHGDGNETEVVIRQADSLADVMDPTDDSGQPEYWIVEDADGLHLMVSVPHWSVHAIEFASVGEFLVQPSVLVGVVAGVGGVTVAGLAMFWPRRDEDEA